MQLFAPCAPGPPPGESSADAAEARCRLQQEREPAEIEWLSSAALHLASFLQLWSPCWHKIYGPAVFVISSQPDAWLFYNGPCPEVSFCKCMCSPPCSIKFCANAPGVHHPNFQIRREPRSTFGSHQHLGRSQIKTFMSCCSACTPATSQETREVGGK